MNAFGTITAPDTVRIERILPGPAERIWAYLTESEKRSRWLASGDMELAPGGDVEHALTGVHARCVDERLAEVGHHVRRDGRVVPGRPHGAVPGLEVREDHGVRHVRLLLSGPRSRACGGSRPSRLAPPSRWDPVPDL